MSWVMRLMFQTESVVLSDDTHSTSSAPKYLFSCDVNARNGIGRITWTDDPELAMMFPDVKLLMEAWMQQSTVRPLRDDGKPNRPLSAFSISPEKREDD